MVEPNSWSQPPPPPGSCVVIKCEQNDMHMTFANLGMWIVGYAYATGNIVIELVQGGVPTS